MLSSSARVYSQINNNNNRKAAAFDAINTHLCLILVYQKKSLGACLMIFDDIKEIVLLISS